MPWRPFEDFEDASVPRLSWLRRAHESGVRVAITFWTDLSDANALLGPPPEIHMPCIVRAAFEEDPKKGRGLPNVDAHPSVQIDAWEDLPRHLSSLFGGSLKTTNPERLFLFVQPKPVANEVGVAFFDGFYFERAQASRAQLASGEREGFVRGQVLKGDDWSDYLAALFRLFNGAGLDIEFARDDQGYLLLDVRRAAFPVKRNELISRAKLQGYVGDPPSPFLTSSLVDAGKAASLSLAHFDSKLATWDESFTLDFAERVWVNVSYLLRLADYVGLPRSLVLRVFHKGDVSEAENKVDWPRLLLHLPLLIALIIVSFFWLWRAQHRLALLTDELSTAKSLRNLYALTVRGLTFAIQVELAASILGLLRSKFKAPGLLPNAVGFTQGMLSDYAAVLAEPWNIRRLEIERWLERYGHRGPHELDVARPRFSDLKSALLQEVENVQQETLPEHLLSREMDARKTPWSLQKREAFFDGLMRIWLKLRERLLEEGGRLVDRGLLNTPGDVFWLRGDEIEPVELLSDVASTNRARVDLVRHLVLRDGFRDELQKQLTHLDDGAVKKRSFRGHVALPTVVEGRAVKADELSMILDPTAAVGALVDRETILVVSSLEPFWGLVFSRVKGVVAEIGDELGPAFQLLQETKKPAVINCSGSYREIRTGDRLRLDGEKGVVEVLDRDRPER